MSHEAVTWAMDKAPMLLTDSSKPDTTARHVLAALAEHARPDGTDSRPSVVRLQFKTGLERRTIQRALRRLEDGGLISRDGTVNGCQRWKLAMSVVRPASDWSDLQRDLEDEQRAAASRQAQSRARRAVKRVTHSDDVTVTDAECVTTPAVTHSDDVSHVAEVRDVTHSASGRHALNAARTILEPSVEPPVEPVADGRRPTTGSRAEPSGGFAAPEDAHPDTEIVAAVRRVAAELPQLLRGELARQGFRRTHANLDRAIRAELYRGIPADRLIERAEFRWHEYGYAADAAAGRIRAALGVAVALVENRCTSPRCDDGVDIDTRQRCRTCEREREDRAPTAKPAPESTRPALVIEPRPARPCCTECDRPFESPGRSTVCADCRAELDDSDLMEA